jgi:hypothetical protein
LGCTGLTPQFGGGSRGVVDPFAEDMYGEVPNELVNEFPNDVATLPALDEYEFSI